MNLLLILLLTVLPIQPNEWETKGRIQTASCTYQSVDQHGEAITLSGRIHMPKSGRAERIILCPHYTITANRECPSEGGAMEAKFLASDKYVLVMPDYIGYGCTVERVHPYLDVHLTVQNTLDMLLATQEYLRQNDLLPQSDSILIVGFSQGAAVAVGCLQQIEEQQLCPVKKCYASSGPYDVAATYDLNVERDYVGMAFVIPAFVMGTNEAYDLGIHPDTIFTPWMLKRYEYALSKEHGIIASAIHLGKGKLSKYLSPTGLDKTRGEQVRLYEGYLRSSLLHIDSTDTIISNWKPAAPLYLMHSTNDELVNFECAEHLRTMFEKNGATTVEYDFGKYGGHLSSMLRFFREIKKKM